MDASILLVGSDDFLTILREPIQESANFSVEVAPDCREAMLFVQAQQPDIVVIQISQPGALELFQQIKGQSRLAWIHCIAVELVEEWEGPVPSASLAVTLPANGSSDTLITALENGADAYLALWGEGLMVGMPLDEAIAPRSTVRLLNAHMVAGLRQVKNHRELMRTNDLLSAIALSDPLTELNNRRALEWELPRQIQNARGRGAPISLIMLDVDYFKTINDTHGHLVGDRALQLLSARLRHNLRFYDTPFRYGGEEFVIILSDTGSQEASLIAHRLCHLVSRQPFAINQDLDLRITISAGASTLTPDDDSRGMSLLHRADQNLLKAKSGGRNRIVSDEEMEP